MPQLRRHDHDDDDIYHFLVVPDHNDDDGVANKKSVRSRRFIVKVGPGAEEMTLG